MGIMVSVPVSVLIIAPAHRDSGHPEKQQTNTTPSSKKRHSAKLHIGEYDQTHEVFDRTQKSSVEMDSA